MAQVINTNVMSLTAQRNMMISQRTQNEAMERLSSGLRINSSADDAAGLAISDRMTAQIKGLDMAVRNSNDAISVVQTADGALQETTNMLQRMRELAIQSANGSNSDSNRIQLQDEVNQLKGEMTRIARTTNFNELNLLDGSFTDTRFHIGSSATEDLNVSIESMKARDLERHSLVANTSGGIAFDSGKFNGAGSIKEGIGATGTGGNAIASQTLTIAGFRGTTEISSETAGGLMKAGSTAEEVASLVNARTVDTGVTAEARTEAYISMRTSSGATGGLSKFFGTGSTASAGALTFNMAANNEVSRGENVFASTGSSLNPNASGVVEVTGLVTTTGDMSAVAASINKQSGVTGITATLSQDKTFIKLTQEEGKDIDISHVDFSTKTSGTDILTMRGSYAEPIDDKGNLVESFFTTSGAGAAVRLNNVNSGTSGAVITGRVEFESIRSFSVESSVSVTAGSVVHNSGANLGASAEAARVSDIDIGSIDGAVNAIKIVDMALGFVDDQRANLGAIQNRLESTINNLTNVSENTSAARSQIRDADFAAESAKLSKAQVLQQAGSAMLAQANASGQQVLQLLQG